MSQSSSPSLDQRLRKNLAYLISLGRKKNGLYSQIGRAEDVQLFEGRLNLASTALALAPHVILVEQLIGYTYKYWDLIYAKEEDALLRLAGEFPTVKTHVENIHQAKLPDGSLLITAGDKNLSWKALHGIVKMCINAVEAQRAINPCFCSDFDLAKNKKIWALA